MVEKMKIARGEDGQDRPHFQCASYLPCQQDASRVVCQEMMAGDPEDGSSFPFKPAILAGRQETVGTLATAPEEGTEGSSFRYHDESFNRLSDSSASASKKERNGAAFIKTKTHGSNTSGGHLRLQKEERGESKPRSSENEEPNEGSSTDEQTIKLYDRKEQVMMLREAFFQRYPTEEKTLSFWRSTSPELILISGPSGTGKTVLARRAMQQLVAEHKERLGPDNRGGYCVLGKFDQINMEELSIPEPYSAFVSAFTELACMLKAEGVSRRQCIYEELNAKEAGGVDDETWTVLRALVPALDFVFQSPVFQSPADSCTVLASMTTNSEDSKVYEAQQHRLEKSVKTFIQTVFSSAEPLVLLLDDIQWADPSSLDLLESLVSDSDLVDSLFLVGICRSNEVPWHHDFACTLRRLEDERKTKITNILVDNLSLGSAAELVADTLQQSLQVCEGVAELIHDKADGNCFHMLEMLKAIRGEGVLVMDKADDKTADSSSQWLWHDDLWEDFVQADYSAVDLVVRRMERLPNACRELLVIASCIGAEFDGDLLHAVWLEGKNVDSSNSTGLDGELMPALKEGMIVSHPQVRGRLAFAHDRIQQAAYSLLPEDKQVSTHLNLGRALYKVMEGSGSNERFLLGDHIFLVVNQLVRGSPLLKAEDDRAGLALMCLQAGRKATRSSAFNMAVRYFKLGTTFLPNRPWRDEYSLCLELNTALAEAECCVSDFEAMDAIIQQVLDNARSEKDKFRVYGTKVYSYGARLRLQEAIDLGIEVLSCYGEKFPSNPSLVTIVMDLAKTQWRLRGKTDEYIMNLPTMSEDREDKMAAVKMMLVLSVYSFLARPELFPVIAMKLVNITLNYGLCQASPAIFGYFGCFLIAADDVEGGCRYGNLAIKLLNLPRFEGTKNIWLPRVYSLVHSIIEPWKKPIRTCQEPLLRVHVVGRRTGESESVAVALTMYCENGFYAGTSLAKVRTDLDKYIPVLAAYKMGPYHAGSLLLLELVKNLSGESDSRLVNTDNLIDAPSFSSFGCEMSLYKLILFYHLGQFHRAMQAAKQSRGAEEKLKPCFSYTGQLLYDALTSLELARESKRRKRIRHARTILKKFETLNRYCPQNFDHTVCLIKAELALLGGPRKMGKAMDLYELAMEGAEREGFLHVKALALERAGVALRRTDASGDKLEADRYLKKARDAYRDWGAMAVVKSIEERYSIC